MTWTKQKGDRVIDGTVVSKARDSIENLGKSEIIRLLDSLRLNL